MALSLTINNKVYTTKPSFAMAKYANETYGTFIEQTGKYAQGVETILSGVLEESIESIVNYYDSTLSHYGKERPTITDIEAALEARIDELDDTAPLFKEIYQELSTSGFFASTTKKYWKNLELMKDFGKTEEEKAQNKQAYKYMIERKTEIEA